MQTEITGTESVAPFTVYEQAEARAKLIAAAPDLLEALRAVTDKLSGCYIEASAVDGDPALIKARAAIAKAEGK